jgi:hypothetical protein
MKRSVNFRRKARAGDLLATMDFLGMTDERKRAFLENAKADMSEQELLKLLRDCVEALAGYRREMNDHQPCDAEKAARAYLASTMNKCMG